MPQRMGLGINRELGENPRQYPLL